MKQTTIIYEAEGTDLCFLLQSSKLRTIAVAGGFLLVGRWHPSCRHTLLKPLWRLGTNRQWEDAGTALLPGELPALNLSSSDACERVSYSEQDGDEDVACCLHWQVKHCQKSVWQRMWNQPGGARSCPLAFPCIVLCPAAPDQGYSRRYTHFPSHRESEHQDYSQTETILCTEPARASLLLCKHFSSGSVHSGALTYSPI